RIAHGLLSGYVVFSCRSVVWVVPSATLAVRLARRAFDARRDRAMVQVYVLARRGSPGVVGRHRPQHQLLPDAAVAMIFERADDRRVERHRVVGAEREAVALVSGRIEVAHSVGQAAGLADDRDRAVAQ